MDTKPKKSGQPPLLPALFAVLALGVIHMAAKDQPEGAPAIYVVLSLGLVILVVMIARPWEPRDTSLPGVLSPTYDLSERREASSAEGETRAEPDRRQPRLPDPAFAREGSLREMASSERTELVEQPNDLDLSA